MDVLFKKLERDTGIEPATKLWESFVMPFHQSRLMVHYNSNHFERDACVVLKRQFIKTIAASN
jgi:hypothetical protein